MAGGDPAQENVAVPKGARRNVDQTCLHVDRIRFFWQIELPLRVGRSDGGVAVGVSLLSLLEEDIVEDASDVHVNVVLDALKMHREK